MTGESEVDFRVVTEGEDALWAYRKFLKGDPLIEAETKASLMDRLPPKIQRIQKELPGWMEKAEAGNREKAAALMQKLKEHLEAKNFEEVEKSADSLLKMMGVSTPAAAQDTPQEEFKRLRHDCSPRGTGSGTMVVDLQELARRTPADYDARTPGELIPARAR